MGLSTEVLKAIDLLGFEQASPIQAECIPLLMKGGDVVGQSQTGSGKTCAFAIPAVERIDPRKKCVQVLILCPTRELAMQVADEVHKLVAFKSGIRSVPIYGGASYERQFQALRQGVQVVIGTPGRVMDHMRRGTLKLDEAHMVILDEADRMLDMGFREDIEVILESVPKQRQLVFFSATLSRPIQDLIHRFANHPQSVRVNESQSVTVPTVHQTYYEVPRHEKRDVLTRLIDLHDVKLAIIFCNTKRMVDDLTDDLLAKGYLADRLHGDISQAARSRVMEKFRKSAFELLVATDVAARGIDVDDVEAVFNYDLPYDSEDYVHRIGRTGRAGRKGMAITFVSGRDIHMIRRIEHFTKTRIQREKVPSLDAVEEKRMGSFFEKLRKTLEAGKYKKHDAQIDQLLEQGHSPTDIASALLHHLMGGEGGRGEPKSPKVSKPAFPAPESFDDRGPRRTRPESRMRAEPGMRTEPGMRKLKWNVGRNLNMTPGEVVGKILGLTKIPSQSVGAISLADDHLFVDVKDSHADLVFRKLSGIDMKGVALKVELLPAAEVDSDTREWRGERDRKRSFRDKRSEGRGKPYPARGPRRRDD